MNISPCVFLLARLSRFGGKRGAFSGVLLVGLHNIAVARCRKGSLSAGAVRDAPGRVGREEAAWPVFPFAEYELPL